MPRIPEAVSAGGFLSFITPRQTERPFDCAQGDPPVMLSEVEAQLKSWKQPLPSSSSHKKPGTGQQSPQNLTQSATSYPFPQIH